MKLHFEIQGTGEPLLILHGLFGSSDNWHSIASSLADEFKVYAVDLRNHGRSPHGPETNYELMAADIQELVDDQGLRRASLLGHSIGGKVAMQFALSWPGRTKKLIVADIAPRAYTPHHEKIFQALLSLGLAPGKTRAQLESALAAEISDLGVRRFLLKSLKRDANGVFHWQINLPALHAHYADLLAALPASKMCDRPALFLRAEKSDYIRAEDVPLIHRMFPRSVIRTIAKAGHWLHVDAPDVFVHYVQEFLRD